MDGHLTGKNLTAWSTNLLMCCYVITHHFWFNFLSFVLDISYPSHASCQIMGPFDEKVNINAAIHGSHFTTAPAIDSVKCWSLLIQFISGASDIKRLIIQHPEL